MSSTWRAATNLLRSGLNTLTTGNSNSLQPGCFINVGSMKVQVVRQLAEGGFAFVYLVKDVLTEENYALKRLLVNDSEDLAKVKEEIEFMKKIPRHKNIVEYRTAGISQSQNGSEVLIIMEFCPEPSLYEILDRRFKDYFTESEVLEIFFQVCESVSHLHSLSPPIAHRDLKVENVLKCGNIYKLCDFGSATVKTYLPGTSGTINYIEDQINRYTTPAYRSPEMVDLWRKQLINEKVDIWALGCLLYRICFFIHPFDEGGSLQILNVNYEIPSNSPYSKEIHDLIQYMIEPDPEKRPTVFQVMDRLSKLRGISNPVSSPPIVNHQQNHSVEKQSKNTNINQNADVFSMLEWQDSNNTSNTINNQVNKDTNQQNTSSFDAFADLSNNNTHFVSAPSNFQGTSFFEDFNSQSSSNSNDINLNSTPKVETNNDLFASFQSTPIQSNIPQESLSYNSTNNNSQEVDFFSEFQSGSTNPTTTSNFQQQDIFNNNTASVGFTPLHNSNEFSKNQLFHSAPSIPSYNAPVQNNNAMHSQIHPISMNNQQSNLRSSSNGSLFNSIVAATPPQSRNTTTNDSNDKFANLRNLI